MEMWKLLALTAIFLALLYCAQGSSQSGDTEYLSADNWQLEPLKERFTDKVADLIKRSKLQQFYGLMGRRSGKQGNTSRIAKSFTSGSAIMAIYTGKRPMKTLNNI
uniref:Uncharacterized protein n=1 Tax=Scleropages formosus TaxID=113540 RepID=A0A8C9RK58_SCLFO